MRSPLPPALALPAPLLPSTYGSPLLTTLPHTPPPPAGSDDEQEEDEEDEESEGEQEEDEEDEEGDGEPGPSKRQKRRRRKKRGPGWCWATPEALDQFGAEPALNQPTPAALKAYHALGRGNVTTFTPAEAAHPLNFFEQSLRCKHCGCDRLRPSRASLCCQGGSLLLGGEPMHEALIDLLGEGDGLSQTSRSLNDLFRFAQQGLPQGSHRLNLAGGHLKVTGVPFSILSNTNASTSTRSFLDDPADRELRASRVDSAYRPTARSIAIVRRVLEDSPLARSLVNWSEEEAPSARLELKWQGSTASVRSFTVNPATSIVGPRTIFFTRLDEDQRCYLRSDDPLYAPLMWPLYFPSGAPLLDRQGRLVDGRRSGPTAAAGDQEPGHEEHGMRQTTLAMLMQPQRDAADECVLLPTESPYGAEHGPIYRRFSALEKLGRLGDEILLDRHLSVHDARLRFLQQPVMQQRMAGQFQPETDAEVEEQQSGTYLPPSEVGCPRYMRDRCPTRPLTPNP